MNALQVTGYWDLVGAHFPDVDESTTGAVLDGIGTVARDVLAPLNNAWDRQGAKLQGGQVIAPLGFDAAYRAFADGGWNGLAADAAYGGQSLPKALELAAFETVHASNMAFGLCAMLSQGAIEALSQHGSEWQKSLVLPKLISGAWAGTMNLTEGRAGSDLAGIRTQAAPDGAGGFRLTGEKIFITWGDQGASENICHLVLARIIGAPDGVKGLSLFLAPKYLFSPEADIGARNSIRVGSIEHKMGLHGSPTCTMLYEGAEAELIGEPHQGLTYMFAMMNAARLQVAIQGVAVADRAYQHARIFAIERRQGRSPWSTDYPVRICDHPDVRRMLISMKSKIVAGRMLCLMAAVLQDKARLFGDLQACRRFELLTPIAKAWCTERGIEVTSQAMQIHGGMGYIEEAGAAQYLRDARITAIYEGTNGIQAIDLVSRKLMRDGGAAMLLLCGDMAASALKLRTARGLEQFQIVLSRSIHALESATKWIVAATEVDRLAAANTYLTLAGNTLAGCLLAELAVYRSNASPVAPILFEMFAKDVLLGATFLSESVRKGAGKLDQITASMLEGG